MKCRGCDNETTGDSSPYCAKCKTTGVIVICAYCGKPLTVSTKHYTTALSRKTTLVHKECRPAYLREFVWTAEKRSIVGGKSAARWEDATYRKEVTEKSTAALRSNEVRQKCSKSAKRRFEDITQRETISSTLKEQYAQPEYKQEVSERMQAFWDSAKGAEAKKKISASLGEFWTDEQRQLKSEFLCKFYQTPEGIEAKQAMSAGRVALFASEAGDLLRTRISESLKRYFSDPVNIEKMRIAVSGFWSSETGNKLRLDMNTRLSLYWQGDETLRTEHSVKLRDYWQTEEGKQKREVIKAKVIECWGMEAREDASKRMNAYWNSEEGKQARVDFSGYMREYWKTDAGKQQRMEVVSKVQEFWKSEVGKQRRIETNTKLKEFWETDAGKQQREKIIEKTRVLYASKEPDETILANMQLYWEDMTVDDLIELRAFTYMQQHTAGFWDGMTKLVKATNGTCTKTDLSRATGIAYTTVVEYTKDLGGLDKGVSMLQQDVTRYVVSICSSDVQCEVTPDFLKLSKWRGQELDIYIPEKKLAIEVNGNHWHSEQKGKDKNYHYNKSKLCRENGIRLIHVWEHEWNNPVQQAVLKSIIQSALGLSQTVYARKLKVEYRKSAEMQEFFNTNNIQGFRGGEFAACLVNPDTKEVLLAYLIGKGNHFSKGYKYEVIRGACKLGYNVGGGFSKVFKHLFADHPEVDQLVYYIDYNYFDGKSLQSNPDWKYKSEAVSFKNYFVATGEVKNRNPGKHKEITQGYADGSILKLWNAGVAAYTYTK